ncbi:hypothetical protein [Mycolicibacterium helvum]|uniref:Secreted protein n=1 Tax=Mycolicibacterium helvum TaxID=1534349 RepID=A0A7I7T2A5_9MYCO|nr:hypothetical protein [Mycolicibacterium helvum]BBY62196.1 hypothetical protein MHEL_04390 [Mycolicibacterium helvum]
MLRLAVSAASVAAGLFLAPVAHATPDTHVPNGDALWCWGGKGTIALVTPYCNGETFPDGSYFHQTGFMQGMLQPLGWNPPFCVDAAGNPFPDGCKA